MKEPKCEVCGKRVSELKPFDKNLCGVDLNGAVLVKTFRPLGPCNEEAEKTWKEAEKALEEFPEIKDPSTWYTAWFVSKYGKEKADGFLFDIQAWGFHELVWQCRDCALLNRQRVL